MNNCYILLGTNLGDKQSNLQVARRRIQENLGTILNYSSVYETEPWGRTEQDSFLNQVLSIVTKLDPLEVLANCLEVEKSMGRIRIEKWMERVIDIDILYFNDEIHTSSSLIIPHPEIQNRRFTLEPLVEISPDYVHPNLMKTNKQLLDICDDSLEVKLFSHQT
jgi:2-amino-4-hydroxy-6-hydroxymethyldihydropteridine diphosphokinase